MHSQNGTRSYVWGLNGIFDWSLSCSLWSCPGSKALKGIPPVTGRAGWDMGKPSRVREGLRWRALLKSIPSLGAPGACPAEDPWLFPTQLMDHPIDCGWLGNLVGINSPSNDIQSGCIPRWSRTQTLDLDGSQISALLLKCLEPPFLSPSH